MVSKIDFTALSKFFEALDSIESTSLEPVFWTLLASLSAPSIAESSFACVLETESSAALVTISLDFFLASDKIFDASLFASASCFAA